MSQVEDNLSNENLKVSEDEITSSSAADSQVAPDSEAVSVPKGKEVAENAIEIGKSEQAVYKEVLEKLKIKDSENINQEQSNENLNGQIIQKDLKNETYHLQQAVEKPQGQIQMEKMVAEDFSKIDNFMRLGLVNPLQGQNLKKLVVKKAFDKALQNGKNSQNLSPVSNTSNKNELFTDFNRNNPDFFITDGRKEVLDYLKSEEVIIGKDDLSKISTMVKNLEKSAIERYLKKEAYEKNLKESNDAAKQKLTANAQNSTFRDKNLSRTFTREQIGKMSSTEFTKYESLIMEQLKKGLIR